MRNPFPVRSHKFDNLRAALKKADKQPRIGVTQGGSSRKDRGARVAARDANIQRKPRNAN